MSYNWVLHKVFMVSYHKSLSLLLKSIENVWLQEIWTCARFNIVVFNFFKIDAASIILFQSIFPRTQTWVKKNFHFESLIHNTHLIFASHNGFFHKHSIYELSERLNDLPYIVLITEKQIQIKNIKLFLCSTLSMYANSYGPAVNSVTCINGKW